MSDTEQREKLIAEAVSHFIDLQNSGAEDSIDAFCEGYPGLVSELSDTLHTVYLIDQCLYDERSESDVIGNQERALPGFETIVKLGSGGMGEVYLARDVRLGRNVAIKWLSDRFLSSETLKRRFLDEAQAMAQLNHPNIAKIYQLGHTKDTPCFVMEYVEGKPINQALAKTDDLTKVKVFKKLLLAVSELHQRGMIHRDLKPENILVDENLEPKVLDFGLAVETDADGCLTQKIGLLGTPNYLSPEQTIPGKILTEQSDIFSLGVLLYELLTGTLPFQASSMSDQLEAIRFQHPALPCKIRPQISGDLQSICLKAMEKETSKRYTCLADMIADLECFMEGIKVHAIPSVYSDLMRGKVERHLVELSRWRKQNLLSESEFQKFQSLYDSTQEREDSWILEMRRLTLPQVMLYFGAGLMVIAQFLVFIFSFGFQGTILETAVSLLVPMLTGLMGFRYWRKQQFRIGLAHLLALGAMLPLSLSLLIYHTGYFSTASEGMVRELFPYWGADKWITNQQLIWALGISILCVIGIRKQTRSSVFSLLIATLAAMLSGVIIAQLGLLEWMKTDPGRIYISLLPVAALFYIVACGVERWGFSADSRYLYPFGFIFTVAALSGIALYHDPLTRWLEYAFPWTRGQVEYLFLTNAVAYWMFQGVLFKVGTPHACASGKCFRFIIPGHVLCAIYLLSESVLDLIKNSGDPLQPWIQMESTSLLYLLPLVASAFVFASIPKQMKNFLITGFIFLVVGAYRLQKYEFGGESIMPILLLILGLGFMLLAAEQNPVREWLYAKIRKKDPL